MSDPQTQQNLAAPDLQHTILVPELLGFSPQLLLDDIISAAADAVFKCLQALEQFMQDWANKRAEGADNEWDGLEAVEQGLVAFSTLLEFHTDIAFDFFEAWSLRNIFAVPPGLPLVAPHHVGRNLITKPEEETELMAEIEDLRRRLENQRRLKKMYQKALRIALLGLRRSQRRVERLSYLSDPDTVSAMRSLPDQVVELFEDAASLPHLDPSITCPPPLPDTSKRLWETGKPGYVNWAVAQLITTAKEQAHTPGGSTTVGNAVEQAASVGQTRDVRSIASVTKHEEEHSREDDVEMDEN